MNKLLPNLISEPLTIPAIFFDIFCKDIDKYFGFCND